MLDINRANFLSKFSGKLTEPFRRPEATLDIAALRASLGPFQPQDCSPACSELDNRYCRFYRLFENQKPQAWCHGYVASGDYNIHGFYASTGPNVKGLAVVIHGYFDHLALYRFAIEDLLVKGYSVLALDLPGHGLSSGEPASIDNFVSYTQALRCLLAQSSELLEQQQFKRKILVGQSTGGSVIMDYLLNSQDLDVVFDSAYLLAPLVYPVGWKSSRISHGLVRWFIKNRPRVFTKNSHDKAFLRFLSQKDPLQAKRLSMQWVTALKTWQRSFLSYEAQSQIDIRLIQGEQDGTVDWRRNLPVIQQKFPQLHTTMVPRGRHQLVNESEEFRRQVLGAII